MFCDCVGYPVNFIQVSAKHKPTLAIQIVQRGESCLMEFALTRFFFFFLSTNRKNRKWFKLSIFCKFSQKLKTRAPRCIFQLEIFVFLHSDANSLSPIILHDGISWTSWEHVASCRWSLSLSWEFLSVCKETFTAWICFRIQTQAFCDIFVNLGWNFQPKLDRLFELARGVVNRALMWDTED